MSLFSDLSARVKKKYVAPQPEQTAVVDSLQPQSTSQPSLFGNTAPGIGQAYTNTLQDSLTGKIYDPFAAGQKEALARAEASKRAATANQIAGAGFSGTGIGQQIAGSTENQLLQNRFSTLNDLEQNRNATRQSALSEARAYGTAEEGIRQYEKDFGEGQRQFDVGQSNWQKNFDQMQKEYGDTQSWKAYEQALATGSDADVIARYKDATGKDLDPMAVEQYRGYYRRSQEQGLAAGDVAIKTAQSTLDTMKRTDAGTALSSYLATHLDADASDPAMTPMLQKYWESLGNTGEVPKDWADQQVKAARDVRLNTEAGKFNYDVDQQVAAGVYTPEQGELLKMFNSSQLTQFLVKDPATGAVKFDTAAYLASLEGDSTGTGTIQGQGGVTVTIPKDAQGNPAKNNGDYFYGEDGNLYQVEDGEIISSSVTELLNSKDWNKIKSLVSENKDLLSKSLEITQPEAYKNSKIGDIVKLRNGVIGRVRSTTDATRSYIYLELPDGSYAKVGPDDRVIITREAT